MHRSFVPLQFGDQLLRKCLKLCAESPSALDQILEEHLDANLVSETFAALMACGRERSRELCKMAYCVVFCHAMIIARSRYNVDSGCFVSVTWQDLNMALSWFRVSLTA